VRWEGLGFEPLVEVGATLTVLTAPGGPRVSFWALQVTFLRGAEPVAAAHTGLQYNPRFEGARAVNWGGYHEPRAELHQLSGSASSLDGFGDDPNTRRYPWVEARPYRFVVDRVPEGWAATVTDLVTGVADTIRMLDVEADALGEPMVWAELFNHCDDPASQVRWSGFGARTAAGQWIRPSDVAVTIPAVGAGGCDNVDVMRDPGGGFLISTGVPRTAPPAARYSWAW
jgi:hypothetical protein